MSLNPSAASRVRHLSQLNRFAIAQIEAEANTYTSNKPNNAPPVAASVGAPDVSSNPRLGAGDPSLGMSQKTQTLLVIGGVVLLGWIWVRSS